MKLKTPAKAFIWWARQIVEGPGEGGGQNGEEKAGKCGAEGRADARAEGCGGWLARVNDARERGEER